MGAQKCCGAQQTTSQQNKVICAARQRFGASGGAFPYRIRTTRLIRPLGLIGEKEQVLPRCDARRPVPFCAFVALPLHAGPNPRMYEVLTANTPGCVAFSLPVQRRKLRMLGFPASFRSLRSQRSARLTWSGGFEPERRPVPGYILFQGTASDTAEPIIRPRGPICDGRRAFRRRTGPSAIDTAVSFPPTCLDGPTLDAPDCVADQDPRNDRADAKRKLRTSPRSDGSPFGAAPRSVFWPSPHPRIRWTVASPGRAICARHAPRPPPSRVPKCPTRC